MATVTIQKRERAKGVKYAVSYYDPTTGKKKYHKTFSRLGDARAEADNIKRLLETGKDFSLDKTNQKMTFAEVSQLLKKDWELELSNMDIRKETYKGYILRVDVLNKVFGNNPISLITRDKIIEYRDKEAKDNSNASANRYFYVLQRIFRKGMEMKVIANDPTEKIKKLSEKSSMRNKYLMPLELNSLLEKSKEGRGKHYLPSLVLLGAEHGASKQECLSLKWEDIDFEHEKGKGIIRFFRTKNGRERTEILMPRTKEALINWKESQIRNRKRYGIFESGLDLVFSHTDGSPILNFLTSFKKACNMAGIEDFHFHDLRHTYCSNLIMAGAGIKDVKEMIGHSDIKMTDRYSHLPSEYKSILQQKLAEHYERA